MKMRTSLDGKNIEMSQLFEKGAFFDVWIGKLIKDEVTIEVAIKKCHLQTLPPSLTTEFELYYALGNHPNLLQFHGICNQPENFSMVTEFIPFSLNKFYTNYHLSWENIYNFGEQIASGLSFLHSRGFGHKHLKSNNVFVTKNLIIKLSDFGLSRLKLECLSNGAAKAEVSVRWRAPETFTRDYTKIRDSLEAQKPADMYSYGVLLWEMATRQKPFHIYSEKKVAELLNLGTREEVPIIWPAHLKTIILNLWSYSPVSRPTAEQVLKLLQDPIFNITQARQAPVLGYKQTNGVPVALAGNRGYIIPNEVAMHMDIINKSKTTMIVIPPEVSLSTLVELCAIGLLPVEQWYQQIERLDKEDQLVDLLNAAGVLGYTPFSKIGCEFVAEKIKIILETSKPPKNRKLLLIPEEEQSQRDFELLILEAIRKK
jgi:serine/threonine protein kinase